MRAKGLLIVVCLGTMIAAPRAVVVAIAQNIPVCTADDVQSPPAAVSDGAGGSFVVWADRRNGIHYDIYAQHILASGAVDPAWPADGLPVHLGGDDQDSPSIITDGAGGAFVAWRGRWGDHGAHHLLASGVDPVWPQNGHWMGGGSSSPPVIALDGVGGLFVAYISTSFGAVRVQARRIFAGGGFGWSNTISRTSVEKGGVAIIAAPGGGAYVAWHDQVGGGQYDILAQKFLSDGQIAPGFDPGGNPITWASGHQTKPVMVGAADGGALIAWQDTRNGASDIYTNHLSPSGITTFPQGFNSPICTAPGEQLAPAITSDGAGGAIISWQDRRSGTSDIYAHHLLASTSAVDVAWPANGAALCTASGNQDGFRMVSDGAGGAFLAWSDMRGGSTSDVYAHHLLASGVADPAWPVDGLAVSTEPENQYLPALAANGTDGLVVAWQDYRGGPSADVYAAGFASPVDVPSPEPPRMFALERPWPNPAHQTVTFRLDLPREGTVSLAVHDALGRRVRSIVSGTLPAAAHTRTWDLRDEAGEPVRAGVYFVAVETRWERSVRRFAVLR